MLSSAVLAATVPVPELMFIPAPRHRSRLFHQLIPAMGLQKLGYNVADPITLAVPAMHRPSTALTYAVDTWVPLHDSSTAYQGSGLSLGPAIEALTGLPDRQRQPTRTRSHRSSIQGSRNSPSFDPWRGKPTSPAPTRAVAPTGHQPELDHDRLRDTVNMTRAIFGTNRRHRRPLQQGQPVFFYTWTPNWTVGE